MPIMYLRKRADKSGGESALNASLPGAPPGTWPTDRVEFIQDPPDDAVLSQRWVINGIAERWIEGEDHEVVTRPAGTAENPWAPTPNAPTPHIFHHYTHLTIAGVRYEVVHNPDKYAADGDDDTPVTDDMYAAGDTRVDWFYRLHREDEPALVGRGSPPAPKRTASIDPDS